MVESCEGLIGEAERVQAGLPFRVRKVSGGVWEVKIDPRRSKNRVFRC